MKKLALWFLLFSFVLACKKEKEYVVNPPLKAQLNIDSVINDSTIVLKWSKFSGKNFKRYSLQRSAVYLKNGQFGTFIEEIYSGDDLNKVSFRESKMPYSRDISYTLNVVVYPTGYSFDSISSRSTISYQRPDVLIGNPVEILTNKQRKWLYITEDQKVTLIDYSTGRQITSKQFPNKIGFCALGDFNGANELYVPVYDGTVLILDGATLQQKEKIYVGGLSIGSVAAVNGMLYVSSSNNTDIPTPTYIRIYDRATKTLISKAGSGAYSRLLPLEGSSVEMVDLSLNYYYSSDLGYYQFSSNGQLMSSQKTYSTYYTVANPAIMRSFPDGSKFITSAYGAIYRKPITYDRSITGASIYSDFAFNTDGSIIYGADKNSKKISAIGYPSMITTKSYPTVLSPFKIFRDGDTLYSLGTSVQYNTNYYMIIEKAKL